VGDVVFAEPGLDLGFHFFVFIEALGVEDVVVEWAYQDEYFVVSLLEQL